MSNDDSFNDSDEIFSLYSSKNVTETFKAQLKKIVASNNHLTNVSSHESKEENCSEQDRNNKEEISIVNKKLEVNSSSKTTSEESEDVLFVGDKEECSLEDSIEVIEEVIHNPTRKSERLRRKRGGNSALNKSTGTHSDVVVCKPITHKKKLRSKGKKQKEKFVEEITLDDSPQSPDIDDELNPEISVKVIWKSVNVKKFKIRKFQKLAYLYELLSKEENLPEDKIMLTFNNIRVNQNDTPDSLNLKVYHFLDGGVLSESSNLCQISNSQASESNVDSVSLKFQDVNKRIVTLNVNKNEKLKVGMIKCSEQLDIPLHKIKFFFDGDLLQPSETPESLGLENGEVIDIKITD